MWARVLRLLALVLVSVFLGYLIGSNQGLAIGTPSPSSPFVVSDLSIEPTQVQPNEAVTITVSVDNRHHTWGMYSLLLKINGVREAEAQANVDAGGSRDASFVVTRETPGKYAVFVNGLSGSFSVVAPPPPAPPAKPHSGASSGIDHFLPGS